MIYLYKGKPFNNKNEWHTIRSNNMDDSHNHNVKQKKMNTEEYTLCDSKV